MFRCHRIKGILSESHKSQNRLASPLAFTVSTHRGCCWPECVHKLLRTGTDSPRSPLSHARRRRRRAALLCSLVLSALLCSELNDTRRSVAPTKPHRRHPPPPPHPRRSRITMIHHHLWLIPASSVPLPCRTGVECRLQIITFPQ